MGLDSVYVMAAGDIAANTASNSSGQAATAKVLDAWYNDGVHEPLYIMTLGDTAYEANTTAQLNNNFDPFWGHGKTTDATHVWENKFADIWPVTGNHEWRLPTNGMFRAWPTDWAAYFGARAAAGNNFCWSHEAVAPDLNAWWRLIGIDAAAMHLGWNTSGNGGVDMTQAEWIAFTDSVKQFLRDEMDAALTGGPGGIQQNVLIGWHEPMFTIGGYSPGISQVAPLWDIVQDTKYSQGGLRVIMNGHDHLYVRYNPIRRSSSNAQIASTFKDGVVELLIGSGGGAKDSKQGTATANVAKWINGTDMFGVARLELKKDRIIGTWVSENGNTITSNGVVQDTFTIGPTGVTPIIGPTARMTTSTTDLQVSANASTSTAGDNPISTYKFEWGDGSVTGPQAGATANHTYALAGTYTVTLTVKDSANKIDTITKSVTVSTTPGDTPPTAAFTTSATGLILEVDASGSTAGTNAIATYKTTWGDGTAGTGFQASAVMTHTYTAAGTYNVTVTVKDTAGLTDQLQRTVTVSEPTIDDPPTAHILVTTSSLQVTADGSTSVAGTQPIAKYAFDWGDGTTTPAQTSPTATHTYAAAGTYSIQLTVSDGSTPPLTDTVATSVTVSILGPGTIIPDDSGSGNELDGEWVRGTFTTGTGPAGHGKAGVFNYADQEQVRIDDPNGVLDVTTQWTAAAWVYLNPGAGGEMNGVLDRWEVLEKAGSFWINVRKDTTPAYKVRIGGLFGASETLVAVDTPNGIATQTWTHVAGTFDGSKIRIYLDGVLVATSANTPGTTAVFTQEPLVIGAKGRERAPAANEAWWNGRLDDVAVFNVALSAAQVQLLMTKQYGSSGSGSGGGFWRSDDARATTPTWSDVSPGGVKNIEDSCWLGTTLYVVSGKAKDGTGVVGVFQTPDLGQTWYTVTGDLPIAAADQLLSVDGYVDDDGNHVLFVGKYATAQSIWRCLDASISTAHWEAAVWVDTLPDGSTYDPGYDQYADFIVGGALSNVMQIQVDPTSANGSSKRVYAMIGEGGIVARSTDNGTSFRHLAVGQSIATHRVARSNPLVPTQGAIGNMDHDLFVTSDAGLTWERVVPPTSGGATTVFGMSWAYDGTLYFGNSARDTKTSYRCKAVMGADGAVTSTNLATMGTSRIVGMVVGKNAGATKRIVEYRDNATGANAGFFWSDSEATGFTKMSGSPSLAFPNWQLHGGIPMVWVNPGGGGTKIYAFVRGNSATESGIWACENATHATTPTIARIYTDTTCTGPRQGYIAASGPGVIYFTTADGTLNRLRKDDTGAWQKDILLTGMRCGPVLFTGGNLYVVCEGSATERPRLLRIVAPPVTGPVTYTDLFDAGDAGLATDDYAQNLLGATDIALMGETIVIATDGAGTLVGDFVDWTPPNPDDQQKSVSDSGFAGEARTVFDGSATRKSSTDGGVAADQMFRLDKTGTPPPDPWPSTLVDPAEMMPTFRVSVRWDRVGHEADENSERFLNGPDDPIIGNLEFTSEMPGGYGTFTGVIAWEEYDKFESRKAYRYGATVTVRIAASRQDGTPQPNAGQLVWQGMLRTPTPKADGTVELNAVGWKVMAEEREEDLLFCDESISSWVTPGSDPIVDEFDKGDGIRGEVGEQALKWTIAKGTSIGPNALGRVLWYYENHNPTRITGRIIRDQAMPNYTLLLEKWLGPGQYGTTSQLLVKDFDVMLDSKGADDFSQDLTGPNLNDRPVVSFGLASKYATTQDALVRFTLRIKNVRVFELANTYAATAADVLRIMNDDTKVPQSLGYTYGLMTSETKKNGNGLDSVMPLWWQGGTWWDLLQYLATMHAFKVGVWEGGGDNQQGRPKLEFRPWTRLGNPPTGNQIVPLDGQVWDAWAFDGDKAHGVADLAPSDDMYSDVDVSFKRVGGFRTRHVRKVVKDAAGVRIFSGLPQSRKRTFRFNIEDPVSEEHATLPGEIAAMLADDLADEQFSGTVTLSFVYRYDSTDKVNASIVRAGDLLRLRDWPNVGPNTTQQPKLFRIYGTTVTETQVTLQIGRTPIRVDQLVALNQLALRRRGLLSSSPGT